MKISKSKQELARIISENGGWRGAANLALFGKVSGRCYMLKTDEWPEYDITSKGFYINARDVVSDFHASPFTNWHQTILSSSEYFHLYPAPDADGWIEWKGDEGDGRPVDGAVMVDVEYYDKTKHFGHIACNINWSLAISYRLHKPEWERPVGASSIDVTDSRAEAKPTIEQLATDYRNAKDFADRKQQEADAAKADAESKLAELVTAGKALNLIISAGEKEHELAITDWRDLRVGDEVKAVVPNGGNVEEGEIGVVNELSHDGFWSDFPSQSYYYYHGIHFSCGDVVFIRRP